MDISSLNEWLAEECPNHFLSIKEGILYLPIESCERLLDQMSREFYVLWGTRNYKSSHYVINNELWISASLELTVSGDGYFRCLVGATTFPAKDYMNSEEPNTHFDGIAKSLCTVNAASDLGAKFGRGMNSVVSLAKEKGIKKSVLLKPDQKIMKQYIAAITSRDHKTIEKLTSIYELNVG